MNLRKFELGCFATSGLQFAPVLLAGKVGMLSRAVLLLLLGNGLPLLRVSGISELLREQAQAERQATCLNCGDAIAPAAKVFNSTPTAIPWTVQKQVNEVRVFFSARDGHKFVQNLSVRDIRITDNGKPALHITDFRHQQDLPLRIGLLIDTSGSVNPRFRFEKDAAVEFLRTSVRRGLDRSFVMGFSTETKLWQDYTDNPELLAAAVAALSNGGGTAFFDAIRNACDKLADDAMPEQPTARVLVVLSDGINNVGRTTLKEAIQAAQFRDVTIYAINTRIEALNPTWTVATAEGDRALKNLAVQSGGRFFSQMNVKGVGRAFSDIEQEMRNRYALFYRPDDLVQDGRFRLIRIAASKSGKSLHVQSRKGYYATVATKD